jgi:hypothetical protein
MFPPELLSISIVESSEGAAALRKCSHAANARWRIEKWRQELKRDRWINVRLQNGS